MVLTNIKIEVSHKMMVQNNLTRGNQYGIPINPKDVNEGLKWVSILDMEENDFDTLETYFLNKASNH